MPALVVHGERNFNKHFILPFFREVPEFVSVKQFNPLCLNGKPVLTCGLEAFEVVTGQKAKLGAVRGHTFDVNGTRVVPTWSPNQLSFTPDLFPDIIEDIYNVTERTPDLRPVKTLLADTPQKVQQLYNLIAQGGNIAVCLDVETSGLNPYTDDLLCISAGISETTAIVITEEMCHDAEAVAIIQRMFDLPAAWTFHNGKFDQRFLWHHKLIGKAPVVVEDTLLLHYALDERVGRHDLKYLSQTKLGVANYEAALKPYLPSRKTSYRVIPRPVLYKYAGYDVCYTLRLLRILRDELQDAAKEFPKLPNLYRFLVRLANGFTYIEDNGLLVDQEALDKLDKRLHAVVTQLQQQLQEAAGYRINPRSPKQIARYLYDERGLRQPTAWKAKPRATSVTAIEKLLAEVAPGDPFLVALKEYRKVFKIWSTYVNKVRAKIHPDGRIRTDFKLHGTVTGRLSSSAPNLMNVPRKTKNEYAEAIRNLFVAPPGKVLIGADYKSAELRALAQFCGEQFLINVFKAGRDIHSETAALLFGPNWVKEHRMIAKMLVFGLIYGRGAVSVALERGISIQEAEALMEEFFERMPAVRKWLAEVRDSACRKGYLVSPIGRVRRFGLVNDANRFRVLPQATNCMPQSLASDICAEAAVQMEAWGRSTGFCRVLLLVHDNIIVECNTRDTALVQTKLQETMEDAAVTLLGEGCVPFETDANVAQRWGDL